jgi:hypothetical protein
MSPRDRKIFQQAFEGDEDVSARSLGTGFYRRVLIQPAGIEEGSSHAEADVDDNAAPPRHGEADRGADVVEEPTD